MQTIFEDEYNEYLQKLSAWETEKERLMVEFTITEKDINADLRMPSPEVESQLQNLLQSLTSDWAFSVSIRVQCWNTTEYQKILGDAF